jgi:hypothetical protein
MFLPETTQIIFVRIKTLRGNIMARSTDIRGGERSALWLCMGLACATPALGGCSLMLTSGPPSTVQQSASDEPIKCSTSKLPPILDTVFAAGQLGRIALAAAADERDYRKSPISQEADILLGVVFGGLFIVSAVHGYSATSDCSEARRRWKELADPASPKGAPPASPAAERPIEFADKPPPVMAAGFELDKPIALAEERCTGAGLTWQALDDGHFSCSGAPVDLGVPVTVKLAACAGVVCKVIVNASSDGAPWSALVPRFAELSKSLEQENGAKHRRETKAINGCSDGVGACFAAGQVRTTLTWRWPRKQVVSLVLDGGPPGTVPVLGIFYGTAALFEEKPPASPPRGAASAATGTR